MDAIEDEIDVMVPIGTYGGDFRPKKNSKDLLFLKELETLPIPVNIKNEAFNVYKQMNVAIKRKNNRNGLKFFCIYNAYLNLEKIKDPKHLANMCGVAYNELNKVFKMFSYNNTGYSSKNVEITPLHYIEDYYQATELRTDEIEGLLEFSRDILSKDDFTDQFPQIVAASIIVYYIWKIHNMVPSEKFFRYIGKSETIINKLVDKIGTLHNS